MTRQPITSPLQVSCSTVNTCADSRGLLRMYADKKVFGSIFSSLLYTALQKLLSAPIHRIRENPRTYSHSDRRLRGKVKLLTRLFVNISACIMSNEPARRPYG